MTTPSAAAIIGVPLSPEISIPPWNRSASGAEGGTEQPIGRPLETAVRNESTRYCKWPSAVTSYLTPRGNPHCLSDLDVVRISELVHLGQGLPVDPIQAPDGGEGLPWAHEMRGPDGRWGGAGNRRASCRATQEAEGTWKQYPTDSCSCETASPHSLLVPWLQQLKCPRNCLLRRFHTNDLVSDVPRVEADDRFVRFQGKSDFGKGSRGHRPLQREPRWYEQ